METTQFELVTPTQTLFSGQAEMIVCRTVDGEIAFLAGHMPYIGALDPCVVRVVNPEDETTSEAGPSGPEIRVAVRGGFVEVKDSQVIMLADLALLADAVDVESARRDEADAAQRASGGSPEHGGANPAEQDLRWAQARLEAAGAAS
jgi:F-type H+-transporting ATPase subunit epsilon